MYKMRVLLYWLFGLVPLLCIRILLVYKHAPNVRTELKQRRELSSKRCFEVYVELIVVYKDWFFGLVFFFICRIFLSNYGFA